MTPDMTGVAARAGIAREPKKYISRVRDSAKKQAFSVQSHSGKSTVFCKSEARYGDCKSWLFSLPCLSRIDCVRRPLAFQFARLLVKLDECHFTDVTMRPVYRADDGPCRSSTTTASRCTVYGCIRISANRP
jgi:hypothetical protein